MSLEIAIVIPARLNSSRLPGKLLLAETGKPLIVHTYEAALQSKLAASVTVATDSKEIADACVLYRVNTCMFGGDFRNGTQRVAAAVPKLAKRPDIVVNLQGDCVGITGEMLDDLILLASRLSLLPICTIVSERPKLQSASAFYSWANDPSQVKAIVENGRCHWFSRQHIPGSVMHVGAYAFWLPVLNEVSTLNSSRLGRLADLEQLDWLVAGFNMEAVFVDHCPLSINTRADYDKFLSLVRGGLAP